MDKAYIVANEPQEREVLEKLEKDGFMWLGGDKPTNFRPSEGHTGLFPYVIYVGYGITWNVLTKITSKEIVFDGRKEEQMSDKYVVSQEFMNELEDWKLNTLAGVFVNDDDIEDLPYIVVSWWLDGESDEEMNNRLIAIIRWANGEDVFEVEEPKKWVVRSKYSSETGEYLYVKLFIGRGIKDTTTLWGINNATKFDTREEAQSWANSHQEVIKVDSNEYEYFK